MHVGNSSPAKRLRERAVLAALLLTAAAIAGPPALDPCSPEGQSEIASNNRLSKPAHGNIDELPAPIDPSKPLKPQLAPIDDANLHADQCRAVLGPLPEINC